MDYFLFLPLVLLLLLLNMEILYMYKSVGNQIDQTDWSLITMPFIFPAGVPHASNIWIWRKEW